jgi:hypothetical protein
MYMNTRPRETISAPKRHRGGWAMDTRMVELVVLGLTSALLCGVAIAANHAVATSVFAGLTGAIGVLAVVLRRSQ